MTRYCVTIMYMAGLQLAHGHNNILTHPIETKEFLDGMLTDALPILVQDTAGLLEIGDTVPAPQIEVNQCDTLGTAPESVQPELAIELCVPGHYDETRQRLVEAEFSRQCCTFIRSAGYQLPIGFAARILWEPALSSVAT